MDLPRGLLWLSFSRRYMFSPKSHSVINIIAMVSVIAVAIPTAAMIILLGMFGGISQTIDELYSSVDADIEIIAAEGQTFRHDAIDLDKINRIEGIANSAPYIEQSIIIATPQHRTTVQLRGIDSMYGKVLPINDFMVRGSIDDLNNKVILGAGVAHMLRAQSIGYPVELYALNRKQLSTILPTSGFSRKKVKVGGVAMINAEIDETLAITDIALAQSLLNYDDRLSGVAIKLDNGAKANDVQRRLQEVTGDRLKVRTRAEKSASLNALISMERFAIILIGSFIAIVAAFSIVGAVIMLITDKQRDIATLKAMGGDHSLIQKIFVGEGMLLTLLGCAIGVIIGVGFVLGQEHFGWIKIPGNMVFESYPVALNLSDVMMVIAVIVAAGWLISRITVGAKLRRRVRP